MSVYPFLLALRRMTVGLNLQRFANEECSVSRKSIQAAQELRDLYVPWYLDRKTGAPVGWNHPNASPVTVGEVAADLSVWPAKQSEIQRYRTMYTAVAAPIMLTLPAYSLPNGRKLILDGKHRLIGLALAETGFEITLWCIDGPIDENALPDLRHWQ